MAIVTEMVGESSVVSPALAAVNSSSQTTAHAGTSNVAQESEMQRIVDMISKLKLNPLAKEFIPSSYSTDANRDLPQVMFVPADNGAGGFVPVDDNASGFVPFDNNSGGFVPLDSNSGGDGYPRRRRNNFDQGRRRNGRPFRAQRGDSIRRTVYVSDIDQFVTEEDLANLFSGYGQVVDCRVCGDPHSRLRFAFIEFADEQSARGALNLGGTMLGFSPVRVLPSKTAILPVNPVFLPRSEDERAMCARTVYCTNIDKRVTQADVKTFFETRCGEVSRLRLLGDQVHSTRIAFVEFAMAESAVLALDCCGQLLGTQPIRVSPSKTPVRARVARPVA